MWGLTHEPQTDGQPQQHDVVCLPWQTLLSPSDFVLSLSHSLHTLSVTGQADGSPLAHCARKSMWIKGYTQQVWRAASIAVAEQSERGAMGGGQPGPPASQALGHLSGVLWNDERAAANLCCCHHGRHCAGRRRRRLLGFLAWKWANEQVSICLLVCVCVCEYSCVLALLFLEVIG